MASSTMKKKNREEIEAAMAEAVELRALHAALMQGNSPAHPRLIFSSSSSHDYPVFTPSYEDEPLPAYQQLQLESRPLSDEQSALVETATFKSEYTSENGSSIKVLDSHSEAFPADQAMRSVSRSRRKNSLGEVISVKDGDSVSCNSNGNNMPKSKGGVFPWRFPRLKKKPKSGNSPLGMEYEDHATRLKKELLEASRERDEALVQLAEMKPLFEDLRAKLKSLERHCEDLKRNVASPKVGDAVVEVFLQIVSEARLSVRQFCKILLGQVRETDGHQMETFNALLRLYNLSTTSKHSKLVLYHLEAVANRALYEDFENCAFRKNGAPILLDPKQDRQARLAAFTKMKKLSFDAVLDKGTEHYNEEFHRFCDRKMSCVISALRWTIPWPDQLVRSFFLAAKWVWLVHLLAFSVSPPLTILRVDENRRFDPHYMEDILADRYGAKRGSSRVKIMVTPGFYVQDKIVRCKVLCRYKSVLT